MANANYVSHLKHSHSIVMGKLNSRLYFVKANMWNYFLLSAFLQFLWENYTNLFLLYNL